MITDTASSPLALIEAALCDIEATIAQLEDHTSALVEHRHRAAVARAQLEFIERGKKLDG